MRACVRVRWRDWRFLQSDPIGYTEWRGRLLQPDGRMLSHMAGTPPTDTYVASETSYIAREIAIRSTRDGSSAAF